MSSRPTDHNSINFIQIKPVIFNKTGTLPLSVLFTANVDLAVVISLKFQIDFKTCRVNQHSTFG